MALEFPNWFLITLYLVLSTFCSCGNGAREIYKLREFHHDHQGEKKNSIQIQGGHYSRDELHVHKDGSKEMHENNHMHAHYPSSSDQVDPSKIGYFTLNDLFRGNRMLLDFTKFNLDASSSPPFLSRQEADSIPFSLTQFPNLLERFSISPGSPQAKTMEHTLRFCSENKRIKGETKSCLTSLESMLDFVGGILGSETPIEVLATQIRKSSSHLFQNYTILEVPKEVPSRNTVACHAVRYPYAVFGCHNFASENKVFKVSLGGEEDGSRVEAVSVCHMDTTDWGADHVAFRLPGVQPGTPICHFFAGDNFLWVSAPAAAAATGSS